MKKKKGMGKKKGLLALIEEELKNVDNTVICPVCGNTQSFNLADLGRTRIGKKSNTVGFSDKLMVQCKHCKRHGKTTLVGLKKETTEQLSKAVINAILRQPPKRVKKEFGNNLTILQSKDS